MGTKKHTIFKIGKFGKILSLRAKESLVLHTLRLKHKAVNREDKRSRR